MKKINFYFDDFDVTKQTIKKIECLIQAIAETDKMSIDEATNELIISNTFKKFMNPNNMLWSAKLENLLSEYKNTPNSIYIFKDKNITKDINKKIISVSNNLSFNNDITKIEAACILMANDYYNFLTNPELLFFYDSVDEIIEKLQLESEKRK